MIGVYVRVTPQGPRPLVNHPSSSDISNQFIFFVLLDLIHHLSCAFHEYYTILKIYHYILYILVNVIKCFFFLHYCVAGSSSDLVPTLMDIFDSMIGSQHHLQTSQDLCTASAMLAAGHVSGQQRVAAAAHFPVLKIVEPGDPEPISPLNGIFLAPTIYAFIFIIYI